MALLKRHAPSRPAAAPLGPQPSVEVLGATLAGGTLVAARRAAARELTSVAGAEAPLAAALQAEPDASVRAAIVTALVGTGTAAAAAALAVPLSSEDAELRSAAIEALQQLGDVAVPEIVRLLDAADPDLRIFAVNVLEGIRPPVALPLLAHVLAHDPDMNVGLAAVELLAQFGGPEDAGLLHDFAARFPAEPFVAFAVDFACRRVSGGTGA